LFTSQEEMFDTEEGRKFNQEVDALLVKAGHLVTTMDRVGPGMGAAGRAAGHVRGEVEGIDAATEEAARQADILKGKWDALKGALSAEEMELGLEEAFANLGEVSAIALWKTTSGAEDAAEAVRDEKQATIDLKQAVADYGEEVGGLPPEKVTEINALIDQGRLAEAKAQLDKAAKERQARMKAQATAVPEAEARFERAARTRVAVMNAQANTGGAEGSLNSTARTRQASIVAQVLGRDAAEAALESLSRTRNARVNVDIITRGGAGYGPAGVPRATGGMVFPGGFYTFNENGQEGMVQDASGRGRVIPADTTAKIAGGGGGGGSVVYNINVNVAPGAESEAGRKIVQTIKAYERANGSGWRN
jgi:hypothetical protein